eukprot:CAMPEP_0181196360 /NCGR_PEP_ID=MMETSP1096-20121128/15417_1 /TAXON_ID=156174 ORGANISM="Chrysochromulina ericina, Strain CCMP281" /NCGR_SAMPLE_ID=MMETSP1096 /ASSEMBLY_ACC=CAM_ASM_000453 /LENGTH=47 /DNA_ID= /DNA_START= /DNA_END= /DNA_ORIENTATION=
MQAEAARDNVEEVCWTILAGSEDAPAHICRDLHHKRLLRTDKEVHFT